MRTINFHSFMLFVAVLLCGGFTACSDDEEGGKKEEMKTTGQFDLSFSLGEDLLLLADVEVIFVDTTGKKTTEKVTVFPWKKTVTFEKVPTTVGYKVNITLKPGVELTKDKYQISSSYKNIFSALQGEKVVVLKSLIDVSSTLTVGKDKVGQLIEELSSETYGYKVDAEYSCTTTELSFE